MNTNKHSPDDSRESLGITLGNLIRNVSTRVTISLVVALCFLILAVFLAPDSSESKAPGILSFLLMLSPTVTMFVATMVVLDYVSRNTENFHDHIANAAIQPLFLIGAGLIAFSLTAFHGWHRHLIFLSLLFIIFVVWDWLMVQVVKDSKMKREILSADLSINIPTILAIVIVGGVAYLLDQDGPRDAFVIGMVCFHLVVTAAGYFLVSVKPGLE